MQSPPVNYTYTLPMEDDEIPDIEASMVEVENLLKYRFRDRKLLEAALTHPSYTGSTSYQRLEFVGDAALGLAFSNYVYLQYPDCDPGKLSIVRAANISTEKLARVAVRHRLYKFIRHNAAALEDKVREFVIAVQQEDETEVYGGSIKAPKVLADIVESVAAAMYVDCDFDLKAMWLIFRDFLEPVVMLDVLEQQPQPVTMLFEFCQRDGKSVDIRHWRKDDRNIASIYVDGQFVASASSEQKENAKLRAARAALQRLSHEMCETNPISQLNGNESGAKQKLHELCGKKKWRKPTYKVQEEFGRAHEKRFICSVEVEVADSILIVSGKAKSKVREAENAAAFLMIHELRKANYI